MARFCTLFSGSSGNSFYVGSGNTAILVDIGRTAKQIENSLRTNCLDISTIKAIFITHEHSDHVKGLRVFASRYGIKVYASKGTIDVLKKMEVINDKISYDIIDEKGICVDGMSISSFKTSHDSVDSVGYVINTKDQKKVVIATDIGFMSDTVRNAINGSDLAVIESNHDVHMLQNGSYPYYLKRRILSSQGHLSNEACAKELPDFVRSGTRRFVLAHLSSENNIPELAYATSICSLKQAGLKSDEDFKLYVAPKENVSGKSILL